MSTRYNPFSHHPPLLCYPARDRLKQVAVLEIGPGRGDLILSMAQEQPDQQFAAIEIMRKRYFKLIRRVQRLGITNLSLICGDARVALPCLFQTQQLSKIYILFLDPWPKDKHAKHRLFQPYFIHDLYRCLKPKAQVILAHDNETFLAESCAYLAEHPGFAELSLTTTQRAGLFNTFYAEKWKEAGRSLAAHCVSKQELAAEVIQSQAQQSGWDDFKLWYSQVPVEIAELRD